MDKPFHHFCKCETLPTIQHELKIFHRATHPRQDPEVPLSKVQIQTLFYFRLVKSSRVLMQHYKHLTSSFTWSYRDSSSRIELMLTQYCLALHFWIGDKFKQRCQRHSLYSAYTFTFDLKSHHPKHVCGQFEWYCKA